jgi:hypothetical protein
MKRIIKRVNFESEELVKNQTVLKNVPVIILYLELDTSMPQNASRDLPLIIISKSKT